MTAVEPQTACTGERSVAARGRLLSSLGEPLLTADWDRTLMMHFEMDAGRLQRAVPFRLDLWEGTRAFVSLVAFTMHGMRLHAGGRLGAWLLKPLATHAFLNVRTYVRHGGECGIHFLAEWLPNPLAVLLGPRTFGLRIVSAGWNTIINMNQDSSRALLRMCAAGVC